MIILETPRLILRTWQDQDLEPMFCINQNPKVMEYFPSLYDRSQTANFIEKVIQHHKSYGFSLYPVILKESNQFLGFVGLLNVQFEAYFTPAVEIGWRIDSQFWGNGYAPEAALAMLELGFTKHSLKEIISFTTKTNIKSQTVMQKIGMKYNSKDDFDHPMLDQDSPLLRHVLYRISR